MAISQGLVAMWSQKPKKCTFKIQLSEDPEVKSLISYIFWANDKLWAKVKTFSKVTKNPQWFSKEFFCSPSSLPTGFSDL